MLESIKLALRISHDKLDADILATVGVAKAEMIRLGVLASRTESDDPIILQAIKTYCLYVYANDKKAEGYWRSWEYQLDCIAKTYRYEVVEEEGE